MAHDRSEDEQAIRQVIASWGTATGAGDILAVLDLMTEDVVFLVAGVPSFGKKEFAEAQRNMTDWKIHVQSKVREVQVSGDMGYAMTDLEVTVTFSKDGKTQTVERAGPALGIFRRESDGRWRLARDANLVTIKTK